MKLSPRGASGRIAPPAVLAALALALLGCSGDAATPGSPPGASPRETAPASGARGPAIDLDCPALFAAAAPEAALGAGLEPTSVTGAGLGDYLGLAYAATQRAGGLVCAWEGPAGFLQLIVLPGAGASWSDHAAELALFQPLEGRFGTSYHACMAGCRADVLVGEHWLSAVVTSSGGEEAAWAIVDRAVAAVAAAGPGDAAPEPGAAVGCDALVPDAVRTAAVGAPLTADARFAPTQPVLLHAGLMQQGGTHCFWMGDAGGDTSIRVGLLPGGAEQWDAYWEEEADPAIVPVTWQEAPPLGDAARAGCFETACFVSVRAGEDWLSVDVKAGHGAHLVAASSIAEAVLAAR